MLEFVWQLEDWLFDIVKSEGRTGTARRPAPRFLPGQK